MAVLRAIDDVLRAVVVRVSRGVACRGRRAAAHGTEIAMVPAGRKVPPQLDDVAVLRAINDVLGAVVMRVARRIASRGRSVAADRGQIAVMPPGRCQPPQFVHVAIAAAIDHMT